jgi:hypothetical protein
MWVFLWVGVAALLAAAAVTWVSLDTLIQPGGPNCATGGAPCPTPPWMSATLHSEETAAAAGFATAGVVAIALFVWSSRASSRDRTPRPA